MLTYRLSVGLQCLILFSTFNSCYSWWAHGGGKFARTTSTYAISKTEIEFQPSNKKITADVGDRFEDVAKRAGVEIQFKCKKGECGTCEIKVDGKWTRTCQLTVPALSKGETLRVLVPPAKAGAKKPSTFFSPASFLEGVVNNGLGVSFYSRY